MASACIKMSSSDTFPTQKYPSSYGNWLSPRISFSREFPIENDVVVATKHENKNPDPEFLDFEFRLNNPVSMLSADELFSDGKLVPLELSSSRKPPVTSSDDVTSPDTPKLLRRGNGISPTDPYLFSPKAPRCSSRWKELLGLKKVYQSTTTNTKMFEDQKGVSRSFKNLLQRNTKTNVDSPSMRLPLLNELESDSVNVLCRHSLSSSSSGGHDHEDFPRLSLDSDKPSSSSNSSSVHPRNGRVRTVRHRSSLSSDNASVHHVLQRGGQRNCVKKAADGAGLTADSPRMNSSGKIVFQSLERSSSSPSSFNGGPQYRHRGMERSYSANVRVMPVLNVPVCSLRGFPLFSSSSQQKKENGGSSGNKNEKNQMKNRCT